VYDIWAEMSAWDLVESTPFNPDFDPIEFWSDPTRKKEFPILHTLAMEFLIVQATSVACESLFSLAGMAYDVVKSLFA
jgi:hypothetical protein